MEKIEKSTMCVQLSKQTAEELREYAKREGRTLSWIFESAVKKYLETSGK